LEHFFPIQYVPLKNGAHRLKLAWILSFVAFVTFCSRDFHARLESEDLRVTRWPAFYFRALPFLPWTIFFNDRLGDAIAFEADQYLGTEGREDREEVENWQQLSPFSIRVPTTTTAAA
jgi:hypothetical protein